MPKAYESQNAEKRLYDFWMEKGYFRAEIDHNKEPFTIIMPPPNITGELHLGHALTATLEDIMTRYHRMLGDPTLWLPGEDHAGIAAQMVVERELAKEGLNRYKIGREAFTERMWQWADKYRKRITEQHMRLGVSCDWSRKQFTLNESPALAVRTTFKNLYDDGLIYRSKRISNWCPCCCTVLSDLEVDHKDLNGALYYIKYPIKGQEAFLTVATTRPETMLGDSGVAVNPHDSRFTAYVGQTVILPLVDREIPVVADEAVDVAFGTGAVKMTPAHDPVDFEVGTRHDLPLINILNQDATINENGGRFVGLSREKARQAVVEALKEEGYLVKIEEYTHAVGHCQRCATAVEPMASLQWFVNTKVLAKPAIEAVTSGKIKIIPEHFNKVYLNWMENIRDWCISRQLWWGHRIPVWYCDDCEETIVVIDVPAVCPKCGSCHLTQDPDVLDTWFSSGLWPHSTLGWPQQTEDLKYFYPTTVMETAYDILFFWVARMIMQGLYNTGQVPFKYVYLHGLIRDEKGEKMSKTKGNVLDPLKLVDQYGADALRFALLSGTSAGADSKMSPIKLEAGRNFANKIYNATRFVLGNIKTKAALDIDDSRLVLEDRWILSCLNTMIADANRLIADFNFSEAARVLHDFIWGQFCDWYVEMSKTRLGADNSPLNVLCHVLDKSLRLLHPFMPFVTEELWQTLKETLAPGDLKEESIMISSYPQADNRYIDAVAEKNVGMVIEIIRSIRNAKAERGLPPKELVNVQIYAGVGAVALSAYEEIVKRLARCEQVCFVAQNTRVDKADELHIVIAGAEIFIPMGNLVDKKAEAAKKDKERTELTILIDGLKNRLSNEVFCSKAPAAVIAKEKERLADFEDRLSRL
ncbi:MAG: valine--tRNA ligase [Chloroflexi bacterium]|nr:valine--tRNA ligase [Chloroflexota bacterium]